MYCVMLYAIVSVGMQDIMSRVVSHFCYQVYLRRMEQESLWFDFKELFKG